MDGGDSLDPKVDLNERINKKMKSSTGSGAYAAELTINNANLSKFGNAKWDSLGKEELKRIQKIEHDQKPNWFTELDAAECTIPRKELNAPFFGIAD